MTVQITEHRLHVPARASEESLAPVDVGLGVSARPSLAARPIGFELSLSKSDGVQLRVMYEDAPREKIGSHRKLHRVVADAGLRIDMNMGSWSSRVLRVHFGLYPSGTADPEQVARTALDRLDEELATLDAESHSEGARFSFRALRSALQRARDPLTEALSQLFVLVRDATPGE